MYFGFIKINIQLKNDFLVFLTYLLDPDSNLFVKPGSGSAQSRDAPDIRTDNPAFLISGKAEYQIPG
jgi:hypothetical protein